MLNGKANKFRIAVILMDLLLLLHRAGLQLAPSRFKCNLNTRGDELMHPQLQGFTFDSDLHVSFVISDFVLTQTIVTADGSDLSLFSCSTHGPDRGCPVNGRQVATAFQPNFRIRFFPQTTVQNNVLAHGSVSLEFVERHLHVDPQTSLSHVPTSYGHMPRSAGLASVNRAQAEEEVERFTNTQAKQHGQPILLVGTALLRRADSAFILRLAA